jgi:hypothetical protein
MHWDLDYLGPMFYLFLFDILSKSIGHSAVWASPSPGNSNYGAARSGFHYKLFYITARQGRQGNNINMAASDTLALHNQQVKELQATGKTTLIPIGSPLRA